MGSLSDDPNLPAHILVVSIPAPGHLIPSTSLAHQLAETGAQVTFLCTGYVFQDLQHRGSHTFAPNSNPPASVTTTARGTIRFESLLESPEVHDLTPLKMMKWQQALSDEEMRAALERKFRQLEPAPCCIVADMLLTWVQDVANQFCVPRLCLVTVPAHDLAFILRIPELLERGELPFRAGGTKKDIVLPGMASIPVEDVWGAMADGSHHNHQLIKNTALRLCEGAALIVNTFEELEADVLKALRTDFVAAGIKVPKILPVLLSDIPSLHRHRSLDTSQAPPPEEEEERDLESEEPDLKSEVEKWLDTQAVASVIYLSFGSLATVAEEDIENLALALEASNYPFLWVYRPPGLPQVNCRSPNNSAINDFLPGFQERVRGRAMFYFGWAPQLQILTHPAIGAFLTHCGWNSALESVCAGVPVLAWPLFADQKMNARFLTISARVGLRFQRNADDTIHQQEIEKVLKQMMVGEEGKAVRSNALKFELLAEKSLAVGGSSATNLRKIVQQYTLPSLPPFSSNSMRDECTWKSSDDARA